MRKLRYKLVIGELGRFADAPIVIGQSVQMTLDSLQAAGTPDWSTLNLTIRLDDDFVDQHVITATVLEV